VTLTLHDTHAWSRDDFDWPNVIAAIETFVAPFPNDATVESVIKDVIVGKSRLWLVRDEGARTVAIVLVTITNVDATGWRRATITGYGGTRGIEALPMIAEIEQWAREHGADEIEIFGRKGWRRLLGPLGYAEAAVILRKGL